MNGKLRKLVRTNMVLYILLLLVFAGLTARLSPLLAAGEVAAALLDYKDGRTAMLVALPGWAVGTYLGVRMGSILPARLVSALSVALYGMFIAIIVPPARRSRFVAGLIAASMALSALLTCLSCFQFLSSGMRVILLTVALSAAAAILKPIEEASA